eukprot:134747_1
MVRLFIRMAETVFSTSKHRALRVSLEKASTYNEWLDIARELDRSQGRIEWVESKDDDSSYRYNWAFINELIADMKHAREMEDVSHAMSILQQCTRKNVGGIMNEDLFSYTNSGEPKKVVQEFLDEVVKTLRWATDQCRIEVDADDSDSHKKPSAANMSASNMNMLVRKDQVISSVKETMEEGGDVDIDVQSDEEPELESESDAFLNMTLTVLSTHPRVFEIKNFLSPVEVDHIVHMATGMKLSLSTTSGSDGRDARSDTRTRTSKNSWVNRSRSPIMDSIYARAADLMQIDEALLRQRNEKEDNEHHFAKKGHNTSHKHGAAHRRSNAEDLQLVHYSRSEQYTAHHDFSYPSLHHQDQPARFATLLLYLNEGMKGGQTTFPRWRNGHTGNKLTVEPEIGKAILFYNQLPDGNMDDLSQHAAEPVQHGEKWLINLWTWDPSFR